MNKRTLEIVAIIALAILPACVVWYRVRERYVTITEPMGFSVSNDVVFFYGKPISHGTISYGTGITYSKLSAEWAATLRSTAATQVNVIVRQRWRGQRLMDVTILEANNLPDATR